MSATPQPCSRQSTCCLSICSSTSTPLSSNPAFISTFLLYHLRHRIYRISFPPPRKSLHSTSPPPLLPIHLYVIHIPSAPIHPHLLPPPPPSTLVLETAICSPARHMQCSSAVCMQCSSAVCMQCSSAGCMQRGCNIINQCHRLQSVEFRQSDNMCYRIIQSSLMLLMLLLTGIQANLKVRNLYFYNSITTKYPNETWNTLQTALDGQDILQVQGIYGDYFPGEWQKKIGLGLFGAEYEHHFFQLPRRSTLLVYKKEAVEILLENVYIQQMSTTQNYVAVAKCKILNMLYQPMVVFASTNYFIKKDGNYDWVTQTNMDSFQTDSQFPVVLMGNFDRSVGIRQLRNITRATSLTALVPPSHHSYRSNAIIAYGLDGIGNITNVIGFDQEAARINEQFYSHQFEFTLSGHVSGGCKRGIGERSYAYQTKHRAYSGRSGTPHFDHPFMKRRTSPNPFNRDYSEAGPSRESTQRLSPRSNRRSPSSVSPPRPNAGGVQLTRPISTRRQLEDQQDRASSPDTPNKWTQAGWIPVVEMNQPMPRRPTPRSRRGSLAPVAAGTLGRPQSPIVGTIPEHSTISHFLDNDDVDAFFRDSMPSTVSSTSHPVALSPRGSGPVISHLSPFHVPQHDYNAGFAHQTYATALQQPGQAHGVPDPRLTFNTGMSRSPTSPHFSRVGPSRGRPGALSWSQSQLTSPSGRQHAGEYDDNRMVVPSAPAPERQQPIYVPPHFTGAPYSYSPAQPTATQRQQEQTIARGYHGSRGTESDDYSTQFFEQLQ